MAESTRLIIVLAVMVIAALLTGPRVAHEAGEREKIYGGAVPQLLTLVAALALGGLLPGILLGVILGIVHQIAPIAFGLLVTIFISIIVYAIIEFPLHKAHAADQQKSGEDLWTAEKARTSGL